MREGGCDGAALVEGRASAEQLVCEDAERVEVAANRDRIPESLLRTQVTGRPEDLANLRAEIAAHRDRDAEVGELHRPVWGEDDVGRLDVPVDDPRSVGCLECAGELQQDHAHAFRGHGALAGDQFREGHPFHEFHHQEGEVVVFAEVMHSEHVGVAHPGQVRSLRSQQVTSGGPRRGPRVQDLDRHPTLQPLVHRFPDLAHPSRGEVTDEAVTPGDHKSGSQPRH